jgi:hypothetical protein
MELLALKGRGGATAFLSSLVTAMIHSMSMPFRRITSLSQAAIRHETESPAKPGVYWFQSKTMAKALKVEVREVNGELTVWWPKCDKPVTHLRGYWQSVLPPSSTESQ